MSKNTTPRGGLEPLLSIEDLSEYIGVPMKTIKDWRTKGEGPAAIKIGNHVRYDVRDVRAWIESCHEISAGVPAATGRR
ncbi:phage transcriptional regulator, AlpA [Xylanimonas cellulosilytica DSM 15894]|uniref:Phage transcriptional regulator, AlpA n=1 Tax=Xylanimonas cellulosilytica (strain DSM 15894 / JCM 12276 / CECT 5975 / KCTC 9989 / LMG 20990 / NBRC 107835 / XIL07) TaxID=446471 RepID=D1BSA6_XYLCX|nr:helix-turn-helix domain-containing protein [Xylanimonas cellulosilytica]ACZ30598.1 phage transcriptional regulator, AlpA [Xylanimonas cellulosilytica DSM 15894]